jgi:hypothetical protein
MKKTLRAILICMVIFYSFRVAPAADLKSQVQSLKALLKEKGLLNEKEKSTDPRIIGFLACLDRLVQLKTDLAALEASLSASGCFDDGRYNSGAVDVQADVNRSSYPHELRFRASSKFLFSPTVVQNELTSTLLNYDHHLSEHLEVYGFIERFSDSFMSIKQRYESGVGFKLEFDTRPRAERRRDASEDLIASRTLEEYPDLERYFEECIKSSTLIPDDKDAILEGARILSTEHRYVTIARLKKQSPFSWGIAFSLLSEVEQAEINTDTVDPETQKTINVILNPSQFFRLTVRPSFTWRFSKAASLNSQLYWKGSLRKAGVFFTDSRLDLRSEMKFNVAKDFIWGGPASVSIDYQFHYDWMPPAIPEDQVRNYSDRDIILKYTSGGNYHHYVAVRFNIKF